MAEIFRPIYTATDSKTGKALAFVLFLGRGPTSVNHGSHLGMKMGYAAATARKSAWQFIKLTHDPRLGMLRKFAEAVGVPLAELIDGK